MPRGARYALAAAGRARTMPCRQATPTLTRRLLIRYFPGLKYRACVICVRVIVVRGLESVE